MKKKILAIAMAVMCLAGMSACGNKQTPSAPAGSGTTDAAQSTGTPEGSESAQAIIPGDIRMPIRKRPCLSL